MNRRWLTLLATAGLAGCACHDTPVTRTGYAATASYAPLLGACLANYACVPLCRAVFQLGPEVDVDTCSVTALDPVPDTMPGTTPPPSPSTGAPIDLSRLRGATLRVTYFEHSACDDAGDVFVGGDDGTVDDGSGGIDDGSDNGSDDGSDDGSMDGGSDDGSGSTDDGGSDDGGGDDGGGDDGGGDGGRRVPPPTIHAPTAPHPAALIH